MLIRAGYKMRSKVLRPAMVLVEAEAAAMAPQREWFDDRLLQGARCLLTRPPTRRSRRAYRKLAKQYHPDSNPGSEDRFKEISAAYDVLGDTDKRKEYDEVRRLGPGGLGGFGGRWRRRRHRRLQLPPRRPPDIFGGLFGRGCRAADADATGSGPAAAGTSTPTAPVVRGRRRRA